jgi:hypothetical protein
MLMKFLKRPALPFCRTAVDRADAEASGIVLCGSIRNMGDSVDATTRGTAYALEYENSQPESAGKGWQKCTILVSRQPATA